MATVSSVTSHWATAKEGFITTLASTISSGAATVPLNSVSGYTSGDIVALVVDPSDATKKQVFTGTIDTSGVQVTGVVWTEGNNQTHTAGSTVVDYETATAWAMYAKGLKVAHNQDGTLKTDVAINTANATLTSPKIITSINDTNNNELFKVTATASAVNELTVANAAAASSPSLTATGSDTNINVQLVPKGAGRVINAAYAIDTWEEIGRTTLSGAGDTITVGSLPNRRYLRIMVVGLATGGTLNSNIQFNGDTGANYSYRGSEDGAADSTATSQSSALVGVSSNASAHGVTIDVLFNIAAEEKIFYASSAQRRTAGAGNIPGKRETVGKWANTAAVISSVSMVNTGSGDYAIGSEVIVYGHN